MSHIYLYTRGFVILLLQSVRWDFKPWPRPHITLAVGGSLNINKQIKDRVIKVRTQIRGCNVFLISLEYQVLVQWKRILQWCLVATFGVFGAITCKNNNMIGFQWRVQSGFREFPWTLYLFIYLLIYLFNYLFIYFLLSMSLTFFGSMMFCYCHALQFIETIL